MNLIDDNQYRIFTGGLPKNWDEDFEHLIHSQVYIGKEERSEFKFKIKK